MTKTELKRLRTEFDQLRDLELLEWLRGLGVKRFCGLGFEIEFHEPKPAPAPEVDLGDLLGDRRKVDHEPDPEARPPARTTRPRDILADPELGLPSLPKYDDEDHLVDDTE